MRLRPPPRTTGLPTCCCTQGVDSALSLFLSLNIYMYMYIYKYLSLSHTLGGGLSAKTRWRSARSRSWRCGCAPPRAPPGSPLAVAHRGGLHLSLSLSLSLYIYMYIYIYMCVYIYVYIYIYLSLSHTLGGGLSAKTTRLQEDCRISTTEISERTR